MKNMFNLLIIGIFLFTIIGCDTEDDTIYWPESLAYESHLGNARIGDWESAGGEMLTFHNSPSNKWAKLNVKAAGAPAGVTTDYYLVLFNEDSFTIKRGSNEYTVEYELQPSGLTIMDNGEALIVEANYIKK